MTFLESITKSKLNFVYGAKCLLLCFVCLGVTFVIKNILFNINTKYYHYDSFNRISFTNQTLLDSLEHYFKLNKSKQIIINGNSNGILIGSPKCGYGNRLNSIISSILIGILLDAQINVKWKNIDKYIQTPIENLFNFELNERENFNLMSFKFYSHYFKAKQPYMPFKDIELLSKTQLPNNYMRYFLDYADPFFMEICANTIFYKKLLYYNLASNETLELASSPYFKTNLEKQEKRFRVGFEVGGNILNRIWKPNKDLQNEIDYYINNVFNLTETYVIGIQLRYGSKWTAMHQSDNIYLSEDLDTLKFINCALKIENNYLEANKNKTFKQLKWFIASDLDRQVQILKRDYPNKVITAQGKIAHVHFEADAYKRAIIDIELLSKCDELIITGGSTFGWMAAMKTLKMPYYINGLSREMRRCERASLSRPPLMPTSSAIF